jgi:hypothetical protein
VGRAEIAQAYGAHTVILNSAWMYIFCGSDILLGFSVFFMQISSGV